MAARLKVFCTTTGLTRSLIAVSSKAKALEAWGVGQDLFKAGLAHEVEAGPDYDAAMARPGEVVQRGEAIDVGRIAPAKPKSKAPADTNARLIKALKAELDSLEQKHDKALRAFDEQLDALEQRRRAATREHDVERTALREKLAKARRR